MRIPRLLIALLTALVVLPISLATQPAAADVDLYTTDGTHLVNGREWRTHCEKYSATKRCWTEIKATTITYADGHYTSTTDWTFNNLTYAASPRSLWATNRLGANGVSGGTVEWTGDDGRQWRTECDTATTGGNGCRSYTLSDVIESYLTDSGTTGYRTISKWVFNSMVRFTPAPPNSGDPLDRVVDAGLRGCLAEAMVTHGHLGAVKELWCDSRGVKTLLGMPSMPQLADLSLMDNSLTSLEGLPKLPRLESLSLSANALTSLAGIDAAPRLKALDAGANRLGGTLDLGALPRGVTELNLSHNALRKVTGSLPGLQRLLLESNRISDVAGIVGSTKLTTLDLGGNQVADASSLGRLTAMVYLNLHDNRLTTVAGLTKLSKLQFLYLHGNQIRSVDGLQRLPKLEELSLKDNPITNRAVLRPLRDRGCVIDVWP